MDPCITISKFGPIWRSMHPCIPFLKLDQNGGPSIPIAKFGPIWRSKDPCLHFENSDQLGGQGIPASFFKNSDRLGGPLIPITKFGPNFILKCLFWPKKLPSGLFDKVILKKKRRTFWWFIQPSVREAMVYPCCIIPITHTQNGKKDINCEKYFSPDSSPSKKSGPGRD